MRKYKRKFPWGLAVTTIIIFIFAIICVRQTRRILLRAEYFRIKDVFYASADSADLSYLKGRNIFAVNLQQEAENISGMHPNHKKVTLVRVLPNRIFVNFLKRNAVAVVKLYKYFCVDTEAVIFDASDTMPQMNLPLISGLETKMTGALPGKKYNLKELTAALSLIKAAKEARALKDYQVKKIDVASINNALFFIGPKNQPQAIPKILAIKFSPNDITGKFDILYTLLTQIEDEWDNVKYIDLRFKEPLMKFNDK